MNKTESMRGAHIHFHPVGLSGSKTEVMKKIKDEEVKFPVDTLSNLIKTFGHEGDPEIYKGGGGGGGEERKKG